MTFHHNYYENAVQRMPRVRFGRVHVFNNYYNQGTYVTMITPTASSTTPFDTLTALQAIVNSNSSNAPLLPLSPTDPATFWFPTQTYCYLLAPVATAVDQDALRQAILNGAGAGKL